MRFLYLRVSYQDAMWEVNTGWLGRGAVLRGCWA